MKHETHNPHNIPANRGVLTHAPRTRHTPWPWGTAALSDVAPAHVATQWPQRAAPVIHRTAVPFLLNLPYKSVKSRQESAGEWRSESLTPVSPVGARAHTLPSATRCDGKGKQAGPRGSAHQATGTPISAHITDPYGTFK